MPDVESNEKSQYIFEDGTDIINNTLRELRSIDQALSILKQKTAKQGKKVKYADLVQFFLLDKMKLDTLMDHL